MKNYKKLTKKEQKETVWVTIGRLRTAIKDNSDSSQSYKDRELALFEKIVKNIEDRKLDTF